MDQFIQSLSDEFDIFFAESDENGRYPYANSLIIGDFLIDTGLSSTLMKKLLEDFQINNVLLSHWHEDHIICNGMLKNAKFMSHILDQPMIEDLDKLSDYYDLTGTPGENLIKGYIKTFNLVNTKISENFEDKQIISIGEEMSCKVIHTPGHTAGHCSFIEENSKIAFLADIDLTRFVFYGGIDSSLVDYEKSIEKVKSLDIDIAVTSHLGVVYKKDLNNKLEEHHNVIIKRDERILTNFPENDPITIEDLLFKNLIYRRYDEHEKDYQYVAERIMIENHIEKFIVNGLITKLDDGYILN